MVELLPQVSDVEDFRVSHHGRLPQKAREAVVVALVPAEMDGATSCTENFVFSFEQGSFSAFSETVCDFEVGLPVSDSDPGFDSGFLLSLG